MTSAADDDQDKGGRGGTGPDASTRSHVEPSQPNDEPPCPTNTYDAADIKVLKGLEPIRKRLRSVPHPHPHPHASDSPTGTPSEETPPDEPWLSRAATTPAEATALLERHHATLDDRVLRPTLEALADEDFDRVVGSNHGGGHILSAFNGALVLLRHRGLITDGEFRDMAKRVAVAKYPVTPDDPGDVPVPANKLGAQTHGELRELEYCYVPMRMLELHVKGWDAIEAEAPKLN